MQAPQLDSGELQITRQDFDKVSVVALVGELDMATTPLLREALDRVDGTCPVVLDVAELTFMDSNGLHAIFSRAATLDLSLARPQANVARLLELTDGDRLVPLYDTLEDALAAASS